MKTLLCIVLALAVCKAAVPEDEVTELPGLAFKPKYKMYSGYLRATDDKMLHYWFVESACNPSSDPFILWMNGGPGCSSMEGFLEENGPLLLNADAETLHRNQYSWNNKANVLYLEAPAGVGFSYSNKQNYTTDDDLVSLDNYAALKYFFQKFPEYKDNKFFITGESYGGIYVPTLSVRVLNDETFNFVGFAVGNGITDFKWNDNSLIYFGYYHGLISQDQWTNLMLTCCPHTVRGPCDITGNKSPQCQQVLLKIIGLIRADDINMYNFFAPCLNSGPSGYTKDGRYRYYDIPYLFKDHMSLKMERQSFLKATGGKLKVEPPCVNSTAMETYLNRAEVREALHIPEPVQKFEICSGVVGAHYKTLYQNTKQFYASVLSAKKRVLIYNGDCDMACNFLGDEWFVGTLGLQKKAPRRQWKYTDPITGTQQVAGFVDTYPGLTFTTIRGAGHMVPQDKPAASFDMIRKFLNDEEL